MNEEVGIIVARIQLYTPHEGQRSLIETVLKKHKRVIIFLGATNVSSRKNPLDYHNRKLMLETLYPSIEIHQLRDNKSNEEWAKSLDKKIIKHVPDGRVILYGSRDSCLETYLKSRGIFPTINIPQINDFNATELRDAVALEYINSDDFRKGIIFAQYNNFYPTAFSTVDVIATRFYNGELEILLGQKPYEVGGNFWRIPGGFIDPTDEFGRDAAARELREETCVDASPSLFNHIEQVRINDWRYAGTEHSIMTTIYSVHIGTTWHDKVICNEAKASDDLAKVKWFKISELNLDEMVVTEHRKCIRLFMNHSQFENIQK